MKSDGGYLQLLRGSKGFRNLWSAQVISLTGDRASAVALLALVLELTGSGFFAGLVLACNMVSPLLVFPASALLLDRLSRRTVITVTRIVGAVMALSMALVVSNETIWIGLVATLGISAMNAFATPASQAAMPNLVARDQLSRANAVFGSSQGLSLGIGPLIGGVLSASVGPEVVFVANAISFLISAGLVLAIPQRFSEGEAQGRRSSSFDEIWSGLRYVRSDRRLTALLALKGMFALAGGGAFVLLPIFAVDVFKEGDVGIGVLMTARGAGAILGPFVGRALIGDDGLRLFSGVALLGGLFGVAYMVFAGASTILVGLPLVALAHTGGFGMWTMTSFGLQHLSDDRFRGRVLSADFSFATSLMAVAMLVTGHWATMVSPRVLLVIEASVLTLAILAWMLLNRSLCTFRKRQSERLEVGM